MESIIGKLYVPVDNSYGTRIGDGDYRYIAGTSNTPAITCKVLTEPFEATFPLKWARENRTHTFVIVQDEHNHCYSVLFYEKGLVADGIVGEPDYSICERINDAFDHSTM